MKHLHLLLPICILLFTSFPGFTQTNNCLYCFEAHNRLEGYLLSNVYLFPAYPPDKVGVKCFEQYEEARMARLESKRLAEVSGLTLKPIFVVNECTSEALGDDVRLKLFYESLGPGYPDSIPNGWHSVSIIRSNGKTLQDQKVQVNNNRIVAYNYLSKNYQEYIAPVISAPIIAGQTQFQYDNQIIQAFFIPYIAGQEVKVRVPEINALGTWWDQLDTAWKYLFSGTKTKDKIEKYGVYYYRDGYIYGSAYIQESRIGFDMKNPGLRDLRQLGQITAIEFGDYFVWKHEYTEQVLKKLPHLDAVEFGKKIEHERGILDQLPYPENIKRIRSSIISMQDLHRFPNLTHIHFYEDIFEGRDIIETVKKLNKLKKLERITFDSNTLYNRLSNMDKSYRDSFFAPFKELFPLCKEIKFGDDDGYGIVYTFPEEPVELEKDPEADKHE